MNRALCIIIAVILAAGAAGAADFSMQAGSGVYSYIHYDALYAGASYFPGYLGATPLRPEVGLGFWRASWEYRVDEANSSIIDYFSSSNNFSDRGIFGDIRLAMDFERIARREGNPFWPAFGAGLLLNWVESNPIEPCFSVFGRMSVELSRSSSFFVEVEGITDSFDYWFDNDTGLNYIIKVGCHFRAF